MNTEKNMSKKESINVQGTEKAESLVINSAGRRPAKTDIRKQNMINKRITLLLLCFVAAISSLHAQKLTVKVSGIKPVSGYLMVGVFNSETGFPDSYYKGEKIKVTDTVMIATFTGLPKGKYAVSVYQDINENGRLDKNLFGAPKEKYGFSNKANKPDYKESLFDFNDDLTVNITLK
jgi:uncharacterized protein (DUF2141 family)